MKKFGDVVLAERPRKVLHTVDPSTGPGARAWFENMLKRARTEGVFVVDGMLTDPLARLLLENNDSNRNVIPAAVREISSAMKTDAFDGMNGQTILISLCGQLNDGQHRLHAKLEAGVDYMTRFMFGLPRETRLTIDQGRSRTAGDFLAMEGKLVGGKAAAVGTLLHVWRTTGNVRVARCRLGRSQTAEYVKENYDQIVASMQVVPKVGSHAIGGFALIAFSHVIFAEINFQKATDFIERLVAGNGLAEDSPILAARRRLINQRRMLIAERLEVIIRAWNALQEGRTLERIHVTKNMPEISR